MQGQKNTRRKRKDPESRDFTCKCGKTYLSYAAAYTHVKKKHNLEREFLDDIGKPKRQKLPRGRPKERNQIFSSRQCEQLSIMEEAILKIYQILNKKFNKIILEGNNTISEEQFEKSFRQIIQKLSDLSLLKMLNADQMQLNDFLLNFNRHFTSNIAARVKLVMILLINQSFQIQNQFVSNLQQYDLWDGQNEVNRVIYQTYMNWMKTSQK